MRHRLALGIEYHGGAYCGWQQQTAAASVQQSLQQALSRVADAPIEVTCGTNGVCARTVALAMSERPISPARSLVFMVVWPFVYQPRTM